MSNARFDGATRRGSRAERCRTGCPRLAQLGVLGAARCAIASPTSLIRAGPQRAEVYKPSGAAASGLGGATWGQSQQSKRTQAATPRRLTRAAGALAGGQDLLQELHKQLAKGIESSKPSA